MRTKRVLVCAPLMPEFDRESGSRRIYHLILLLKEAGWSVTFFAENMTGGERYARILRQHGIMVYGGIHSRWIADDEYLPNPKVLLETGQFDLVLVAFWYFGEMLLPLIRAASPHTRVLVDSIDLHCLRLARKTFHRDDPEAPPNKLDLEFASEMIREINVYAAADGVLTVSQKEADWISDFLAMPGHAHAVPDMEELEASPVPYEERRGILFVGNFRHTPNVQAVEFLFEQIVPRLPAALLRRHPLYIVGNALDEKIRRLGEGFEGVKMVGWVPSVEPYFRRARVSIVPLLHGAGTKRKVIETLTIGTPCVSTRIGAEGLGLVHGEQILIADDPEAFAAATEILVDDAELWHRLAHNGRRHIGGAHGRDVVRQSLSDAVAAVMERVPGEARPSSSLAWLSGDLAGKMQRAKVGLKHLLRTVTLRDQMQ